MKIRNTLTLMMLWGLASVAFLAFCKLRIEYKLRNAYTCRNNMCFIDSAKEKWALDIAINDSVKRSGKSWDQITPPITELYKYMPATSSYWRCPDGGAYSVNAIGWSPVCNLAGHRGGLRDPPVEREESLELIRPALFPPHPAVWGAAFLVIMAAISWLYFTLLKIRIRKDPKQLQPIAGKPGSE